MSENSNSDVGGALESSSAIGPNSSAASLDDALEQCVLALENGATELDSLVRRFPQWEVEIAEFLDNWGGMEGLAKRLLEPQTSADSIDIHQFPNRRFGDYELLEKIGVGGMGVIYKARQIRLDRIVALKMIHGERHDRNRFQLEAESAAALSHPNIVSIHEIGEHQGHLFFTMNLVAGCDLKEYLDRGPISISEAARITKTIANAVHYAHQHGILHRDLKPANVMLDIEIQPHITDFGLAKQLGRDTEITRSGTVMGTPGYMAPEQAAGRNSNLTMATDVYGVGAILYSLLTRQAPFTGDSSLEILRRVVDEPPVSPRTLRPEIPRDLDTICMKCLEKSPEMRYATAKLLADDLSRFMLGQPVIARPISTTERFWRWCCRNPALSILSATVLILLVAATVVSILLAFSERNARLLSESGDKRERQLLGKVEDAELLQHQARVMAMESSADKYLSLGLAETRRANIGDALFWMTQAAILAKQEPQQFQSQLIRIQSWLDEAPIPIAAIMLKHGFGGKSELIQFRNGADQLLCTASHEYVVIDYAKNEQWNLEESFADISVARWSDDGRLLAIGEQTGRVLLLDADSHEIQSQFDVGAPVGQIAFSNQSAAIAIATRQTSDSQASIRIWDNDQKKFQGDSASQTNDIVYQSFNPGGDRLITVNRGGKSNVYSTEQEQLEALFEITVRIGATSDYERPFWPTPVHQDSLLMVRSNSVEMEFYNLRTGDHVASQPVDRQVVSIVVSPDSNRVVLCGNRSAEVARLIPISESSTPPLRSVDRLEHEDRVVAADIGNHHLIATGGWDHQVSLWRLDETTQSLLDIPYQKELLAVLPHQNRVRQIVFSPDGSKLVTVQQDGLIRLWNLPAAQSQHFVVSLPKSGSMAKLAGRNHWLCSGLSRKTGQIEKVGMYETVSGKLVGQTTGNIVSDGAIMDTAISPDRDRLATIHTKPRRTRTKVDQQDNTAGSLKFWNWPEGEPLGATLPMPSEPRSVDYHPDGRQLAVFTAQSEIVLVDALTLVIQQILNPFDWATDDETEREPISRWHYNNGNLKYSPDGQTIVAWGGTEGVWVWDAATGRLRFPCISNGDEFATSVEFSPDGNRVVIAGGRDPNVRVLDVRSGEVVGARITNSSLSNFARFSPDGDKVIIAYRDGNARIYDWRTGELQQALHLANVDVADAAFTPDSKYIVTLGLDHRMCLWDARDKQMITRPIRTPAWARQILITPDSHFVIIASGRHQNVCFELASLQQFPDYDLDQLQLVTELLSGKTMNANSPTALATSDWFAKWQAWSRADQKLLKFQPDDQHSLN